MSERTDNLTAVDIETAALVAWYQARARHPKMDDDEAIRAAFVSGFAAGASYGVGLANSLTD